VSGRLSLAAKGRGVLPKERFLGGNVRKSGGEVGAGRGKKGNEISGVGESGGCLVRKRGSKGCAPKGVSTRILAGGGDKSGSIPQGKPVNEGANHIEQQNQHRGG